jgi:hypothetical protein
MVQKVGVKDKGGESVTVTETAPATVHRVFAHTDVPDAAARRVADWVARRFAGFEIDAVTVRPPDVWTWYARQSAAGNGPRRPYPLARVLVRYPSFMPAIGMLRGLSVELADGRVVPGASDEAQALLGRARVFWRLSKGIK